MGRKATRACLMLDDLLPQSAGNAAKVKIDLPARIGRSFRRSVVEKTNEFDVTDIEKAVFVVGQNWRDDRSCRQRYCDQAAHLRRMAVYGRRGREVRRRDMRRAIRTFSGGLPNQLLSRSVQNFPATCRSAMGSRDARAGTSRSFRRTCRFKSQSLQRLHEQLRHEMFHLWIPNGVNLSGQLRLVLRGICSLSVAKAGRRGRTA